MPANSPIERVILACLQCRSRRVKCDGKKPTCDRCVRDRKDCTYQASRRGGLDKAALAKRRLRLRQEAQVTQAPASQLSIHEGEVVPASTGDPRSEFPAEVIVQISKDRLLELYYENFWRPFPFVLPHHFLQQRLADQADHGLAGLVAVLHWIGARFAPWAPTEVYYEAATRALRTDEATPFQVQALMLFALAQHHCDLPKEARQTLDVAVALALQLHMHEQAFARTYGEGNPVLEESWRRTIYILYTLDQEFAIIAQIVHFSLLNVAIEVDLPCDDEAYMSGCIPEPALLADFKNREFEEIEVVYSSLAYFYEMSMIMTSIMSYMIKIGFTEELVAIMDTKIAAWHALLPARKKDPLRLDGTHDEVMWQAHLSAAIVLTMHRPFSALSFCPEEFTTETFIVFRPLAIPDISRKAAHTARTLKSLDLYTKLLAVPVPAEKHGVLALSIVAQMATTQMAACKYLLEDHALAIGRDRLRLSIGYLNTVGSFWPLGKKMAKEVKAIARSALAGIPTAVETNAAEEIDITRDELIWPMNPSVNLDIYAGTVLPFDSAVLSSGYSSSSSSTQILAVPSTEDDPSKW
ncbi:hypothetical protein ACN47E_002815 [Coniothyrium glycines]